MFIAAHCSVIGERRHGYCGDGEGNGDDEERIRSQEGPRAAGDTEGFPH